MVTAPAWEYTTIDTFPNGFMPKYETQGFGIIDYNFMALVTVGNGALSVFPFGSAISNRAIYGQIVYIGA